MPKSTPPGSITIAGRRFRTDAMPDPFDERDYVYRPKLVPLPPFMDPPARRSRYVLTQEGQSCTGHALATMINAVLASIALPKQKPVRVSPYMLYALARRYDEFPGESDTGSSLRGALKGWFFHGVCREDRWKFKQRVDPSEPAFARHCREVPLGAFYRVNCYRLDDMQSAVTELHAIVASAQIHEGWEGPQASQKGEERVYVIRRKASSRPVGGHAFAIVGYNEIGFVVQNSWGTDWGDGGLAILTYEDWLDSAYDAWVVRPGVPHTPFVTGRRRDEQATDSVLALGVGPDRRRLDRHVVNLGNDGRLSSTGKFTSTVNQLDRIIVRMREWHDAWAKTPEHATENGSKRRRHIVLYAHGGLVSETSGLEIAQKHLNWWLNNRIYPIYFAWQSGPAEALLDEVNDRMSRRMPAGGIGFDLVEQFDRLVELSARHSTRWMWDQLKQNARSASARDPEEPDAAGATRMADRLAKYVRRYRSSCAIHLVGHSAGSIFLAHLLARLVERKVPIETLVFMAPAIRIDEFETQVGRHLRHLKRFVLFNLSEQRELDDTCGVGPIPFYQKSLLYLVSRALEALPEGKVYSGEIPLLGMAKYADSELEAAIRERGLESVFVTAPRVAPARERTDAVRHSDFDDDGFTMTSVAMQLLQSTEVEPYRPHAPLLGIHRSPGLPVSEGPPRSADTQPPGQPPVVQMAEEAVWVPEVPPCRNGEPPPELGAAPPGGDQTGASLRLSGWNSNGARRKRKKTTRGAIHA